MIAVRTLFWLCLVVIGTSRVSVAQVTDTTKVPPPDTTKIAIPDSVRVPPQADSTDPQIVIKPQVPFWDDVPGQLLTDSLPTIHPALDPASLLSDEMAGSFLYDFGVSGWPDGWSPAGIAPHDVSLSFNDIPFENSVSGTAEYELLPFPMLQPFRLHANRFGAPLTVNTRLRSMDEPRPLTEIRYRQSNLGLKSILVFHSQQRRIPLRQQMGMLGITLAYGGHGANGEYAGSQLEGGRQLLTRFRYKHPWGSIELLNFSNRRRLGAHGGVIPAGDIYETIYNRFGANVANASAQRQSLRNDLSLTVRSNVLPDSAHPFTASGYWTAATFRYVLGDTLQARTSRLGYRLSQSLALGEGDIALTLEGWTEHLRNGTNALPDSLDPTRSALHLSALTSLPAGPLTIEIEPAFHKTDQESFFGGRTRLSLAKDWLQLFAQVSYSGQTDSWIQQHGWGNTVSPLAKHAQSRVFNVQAGLNLQGGPFNLDLTTFANRTKNYTDFFLNEGTDSLLVQLFPSSVQWAGLTASLGFRKNAARGIYLTFTPTIYKLTDASSSPAHSILMGSMPELYVRGRLGLRYLIFRGDLDLDLYSRARLWSSFDSRTLHPETGLLVLRPIGSRPVDASIAMDVVLEAGIRTAKLFLAFENVLSHPSIIVGNVLVPDYPLPAQRFRFGVYWPIQD